MRSAHLFIALAITAIPVLAQTLPVDSDTTLLLRFEGNMNGVQGQTPQSASGVQFVPGLVGQGVNLAAGSQVLYAAANNINALEGTLEFWIKPNWNGNNQQNNYILSWGATGGLLFGKDAFPSWRMIANRFVQEKGVGVSAASWQAGQWKHAAFTWSATSLCLYLNGSLVAQQAVVGGLPPISASTFQLGGDGTNVIDAVIDELRISKRARTADEIAADFVTASAALGQFLSTNSVPGQYWVTLYLATHDSTIIYDGHTTTESLFPGSGTLTHVSPPNTPNLTQATGQIDASEAGSCPSSTLTSTAFGTANLATGTLGVHASGSAQDGNTPTCSTTEGTSGLAEATMLDALTFYIPGATSSTVTNIGVSYKLDGSYTPQQLVSINRGDGVFVVCCPLFDNLTAKVQLGGGSFGWSIVTLQYQPLSTHIDANSGWVSSHVTDNGANGFAFEGVLSVTGANPVVLFNASLQISCSTGDCDYSHTRRVSLNLPSGVTVTSGSGVFLTQASPTTCNYTLDSGGQAFSASGGIGTINVAAPAGCPWNELGAPSWMLITSGASGTGNGTLTYQVQPNAGADQTAALVIGGQSFLVAQPAASITGLNLIGSMPHIAAEENWTTMFTMVNDTGSSNQVRFSLFGSNIDASGSGNALQLPLSLPQQPNLGVLAGASLDNTLSPNASWIVSTAGQGITPVQTGSAQVSATGALGGFAIFHRFSDAQEAVVPLTPSTPNPPSYLLAFDNTNIDNTNKIVTAVAVANVSTQAANIGYIIRDDTGAQIGSGTITPALPANGQIAFDLPDAGEFPITANKRGTVEFDTPAGGQLSVLGVRNTPQVTAQGTVTTLTTVPPLVNVGTGGGSFAFLASGGDGWETTFVLVNTGGTTAPATLKFFDPNGNPLPLPLSYPQTGAVATASFVTQSLVGGATLLVQSSGAASLLTGSAQLTASGKISGFAIFRYTPTGQEAVVPIESRNASAYVLAFDNTGGTATGISVNNVTSGTQPVTIPVVIRDDSGNQLATDSLTLAANGDFAGDLAQTSTILGRILFPSTANIRGTVEFDAPAGAQISVLGVRTPLTHTYTTLPALAK